MHNLSKMSRREFNQKAGRYLGAIGIASTATSLLWSCTQSEDTPETTTGETTTPPTESTTTPPAGGGQAAAEIKMVDPQAPQAKALNYCPDANSPTPLCPSRADQENSTEFCSNCLFFQLATAKSTEGSAITDAHAQRATIAAECQLLPGQGYVAGQGWCRSWALRQG